MGGGALIVLDTHVAVWYASGIKLRRAATSALEFAVRLAKRHGSKDGACEI
jgi:hypothetical protein